MFFIWILKEKKNIWEQKFVLCQDTSKCCVTKTQSTLQIVYGSTLELVVRTSIRVYGGTLELVVRTAIRVYGGTLALVVRTAIRVHGGTLELVVCTAIRIYQF